MRTVIIATGYQENLEPLVSYIPTPLFQVVDKPILFHVIEFLKKQGIVEFDIIVSHLPQRIEKKLGHGEQWGIQLTYHLAKDSKHPFSTFKYAAKNFPEGPILLCSGSSLPQFEFKSLTQPTNVPTLLLYPEKHWTEWCVLPSKFFTNLSTNPTQEELFELLKSLNPKIVSANRFLECTNFLEWQKSNQRILTTKDNFYFPATAKIMEPNVWISHADSIHPTAKIVPPVFIGENCKIKEKCSIGPNAIIEKNCIVDKYSNVEGSLICQNSYVGEGLDIKNSIVNRNILISLLQNTQLFVKDDFILSSIYSSYNPFAFYTYLQQVISFFLLMIFSPVLFIILLSGKKEVKDVVSLPASEEKMLWKTVSWISLKKKKNYLSFSSFIVQMLNVLKGRAHFVGVPARTIEEVENLPMDWRKIYLKSKIGIITLIDAENIENETPDDMYSAEVFYNMHKGFWFDCRLILLWLKNMLFSLFKKKK